MQFLIYKYECKLYRHLYFTIETAARKYTQLNSEKQIKQYSTKSCASEQLKSVKDDLGYLAHVAQMNGHIDTNYSQRPHTVWEICISSVVGKQLCQGN